MSPISQKQCSPDYIGIFPPEESLVTILDDSLSFLADEFEASRENFFELIADERFQHTNQLGFLESIASDPDSGEALTIANYFSCCAFIDPNNVDKDLLLASVLIASQSSSAFASSIPEFFFEKRNIISKDVSDIIPELKKSTFQINNEDRLKYYYNMVRFGQLLDDDSRLVAVQGLLSFADLKAGFTIGPIFAESNSRKIYLGTTQPYWKCKDSYTGSSQRFLVDAYLAGQFGFGISLNGRLQACAVIDYDPQVGGFYISQLQGVKNLKILKEEDSTVSEVVPTQTCFPSGKDWKQVLAKTLSYYSSKLGIHITGIISPDKIPWTKIRYPDDYKVASFRGKLHLSKEKANEIYSVTASKLSCNQNIDGINWNTNGIDWML